uniref:Protein Wnt n=1 Tax=Felis catus TaxID=9685 RepID=A0ABI8A0N0_FELCA
MRARPRVCEALLFALALQTGVCYGIKWLALSKTPAALALNQTQHCKQLEGLVSAQVQLCRSNLELMHTIVHAAREVMKACRRAFADMRWNCSSIELAPNYLLDLERGTRESAFVYALSAAAISHAIARACTSGDLPGCSCGPVPGSATRRPTAVTAVTSCAADAATTPTRTAWSSGATANTIGAATSPAVGVSAPWSAMSASEALPTPWGLVEAQPGARRHPVEFFLGIPDARHGRRLVLCLPLETARNRRPGRSGRRARTSKETDKIKNNLAARAWECPLAAFQTRLRSQGYELGRTGMDLTFRSRRHQPPGKGGLPALLRMPAGPALATTPGPPQGLSLLGIPHGTTSLGCKCFLFCFVLFSSSGMWELQKYL